MSRMLTAIMLAALLAAPLQACGKKGPLEPPPAAEPSEAEKKPKRASE